MLKIIGNVCEKLSHLCVCLISFNLVYLSNRNFEEYQNLQYNSTVLPWWSLPKRRTMMSIQ